MQCVFGMTRNSLLDAWIEDPDYFSAMAVLSSGPLHPGGMIPNGVLAQRLDWNDRTVLDVGAGTGVSHRFFEALGAKVISAEPNEWMRRAAVRGGVDPRNVVNLAAADITPTWLSKNVSAARLLVQGVTGFLPQGLGSLAPIMQHDTIEEVVFVEWVGSDVSSGGAPVQHSYHCSEIVAAVEEAGFKSIWLETLNYRSPSNSMEALDAERCVEWHFPESAEVAWKHALPRKLEGVCIRGDVEKDYVILVGKKRSAPSNSADCRKRLRAVLA